MTNVLSHGLQFHHPPPAPAHPLSVPSRSPSREQRGLAPLPLDGEFQS